MLQLSDNKVITLNFQKFGIACKNAVRAKIVIEMKNQRISNTFIANVIIAHGWQLIE